MRSDLCSTSTATVAPVGPKRSERQFVIPQGLPHVNPADVFGLKRADGSDESVLTFTAGPMVPHRLQFQASTELVGRACMACADVIDASVHREPLQDPAGPIEWLRDGWVAASALGAPQSYERPGGWAEFLSADTDASGLRVLKQRLVLGVDDIYNSKTPHSPRAIGLMLYDSSRPGRHRLLARPDSGSYLVPEDLEHIHRLLTPDNALQVAQHLRSLCS